MSVPGVSHKKRLIAILLGIAIIFFALILRLGWILFIDGENLQAKAVDQWTRELPVASERGSILDRNGQVFVQNATSDMLMFRPAEIKKAKNVDQVVSGVCGILTDLDAQTVREKATDNSKSEVLIKRQIDRDIANKIRELDLKGVYLAVDTKRYYPLNNFLTQVLGFTSVDGEGLDGLEKRYNEYLTGVAGSVVAETDRKGNQLSFGAQSYIPPKDGYSLKLTVDYSIQSFLEKALDEALEVNNAANAQGIVLNPQTGEIYAMCTKPDYDLNNPPRNDTELLQELSRNRVVTDAYEPGSTFKIVTLASGLDSGAINLNSTFDDPGYRVVGGRRISCWTNRPHGHQTLAEAVQNSCNPAFMDIGMSMGVETFYDYIYNFGFGQKTNIDYSADGTGIVMNQKYVKEVDIACISFGQSIAVTPLQLAAAASAAVNGGHLMQPYLVKEILDSEGNTFQTFEPTMVRDVISEETSAQVREILEGVVREGSGKNAYIPGYRVGGKTGTAQKMIDGKPSSDKLIASFIGFAPADDPQLLCLILVDEPQTQVTFGSVVAAPFVKNVLEDSLKYMGVQPQYDEAEKEKLPEEITVPDVSGMILEDAKSALSEVGLECWADGEGVVLNQMPQANSKVWKDSVVLVYMSEKTEVPQDGTEVTVPDLKNMTILDAAHALEQVGLRINPTGSGLCTYQRPHAGETVPADTLIDVEFTPPGEQTNTQTPVQSGTPPPDDD